jgi:hypothetical protein
MKTVLDRRLRREAELWVHWRPWIGLFGIVVPVGLLLAAYWNGLWVIYAPLWMKFHHGIRYEIGMTRDSFLTMICCQAMALASWSWTSGFALGSLSRRTVWINGALFCLVCLRLEFFLVYLRLTLGHWGIPIATLGLVEFAKFILILFPFCLGVRRAFNLEELNVRKATSLAAWICVMTILAFWTRGWFRAALENWSTGGSALSMAGMLREVELHLPLSQVLLAAIMVWLVTYILATAFWRHTANRPASAA